LMIHPIKAVFASCVFSRSFRYWIKRKTRQIRVCQIKLLAHQMLNKCPISPDFHPLLLRSKSITSNQSRLPDWRHFHIR